MYDIIRKIMCIVVTLITLLTLKNTVCLDFSHFLISIFLNNNNNNKT